MVDSRALTTFDAWFRCGNCKGEPGRDFWRVIVDGRSMVYCPKCAILKGLIW